MNTRKASRSRLADVLADIKKHGDDNDVTPPPPKRRSTAAHHHNHNESKSNLASATSTKATPSYRLRIYDRSIQFSGDDSQENIPLYSLVRSWVHGGSKKAPKKKTVGKEGDGAATTTAANTTSSNTTTTQSESIFSLPPPKSKTEINEKFKIYPTTEEEVPDIRIPPWVKSFKRPDDVEKTLDESIGTLSQAECIQLNKQRWKKAKGDWKLARRYHEARYEESFKTLHDMWATQHEK